MFDLYLEPLWGTSSLDVEPRSEIFIWNLYVEIFMWSFYPEPSWQTFLWNIYVEPLCETSGTWIIVEPFSGAWNLGTCKSGTCMWNLGEPDSRFQVAAPNHPRSIGRSPSFSFAVGDFHQTNQQTKWIPRLSNSSSALATSASSGSCASAKSGFSTGRPQPELTTFLSGFWLGGRGWQCFFWVLWCFVVFHGCFMVLSSIAWGNNLNLKTEVCIFDDQMVYLSQRKHIICHWSCPSLHR